MTIYTSRFRFVLHFILGGGSIAFGTWNHTDESAPVWVSPVGYFLLGAFILNIIQMMLSTKED